VAYSDYGNSQKITVMKFAAPTPVAAPTSDGGCSTQYYYNKFGEITYSISCGVTTVYKVDPVHIPVSTNSSGGNATVTAATNTTAIVAATTTTSTVSGSSVNSFQFLKNLQYKDVDTDILKLQHFLNTHNFSISKTGPGSLGKETTYFGRSTRAALIKFQQANDIKPASGYFGSITKSVVNSML
jgi:hypothetical protein